MSTLQRRLRPETARAISTDVLNLSARRVSPYVQVDRRKVAGADVLTVSTARTRIPLADYTPRVSRKDGVTVTTWRDAGPKRYPHAFRRKDKAGIWQRIPSGKHGVNPTPSGLVQRLPIVERKGPSIHRVFVHGGRFGTHVDLRPRLAAFVETTLAQEVARLLRVPR
ncbi:hypothetical protein WCE39_07945 [Luteimonas sp. MJ174]|uniref:hypothetical protein n=1 Tax=Luteimonas sp. MJ174 TaxID=3129237 RepID=UPI0031BB0474